VKLSSLERLPSFALLGPGFAAGRFVLLTELSEGATPPALVYAPFETPARTARVFAAGGWEPLQVEFDVAAATPAVVLRADGYQDAVERIREAIAAGDVYQVCYTVHADLDPVPAAALFARLCARGLPRFAAWVRLPDGEEFVSASPELFFTVDGRTVRSEPMKGTAAPDAAAALAASAKDRAELAMITDLVRNDLASVCRPRSVRVECERLELDIGYAHQTVSDVRGELPDGATALDVLAALHPGGSVTGAPKQAALRMIREMEPGPRGAYCGTLGLWGAERSVFSLLIRTAARSAAGWVYGVGSGIVYDSDPERELAELRVKLGILG